MELSPADLNALRIKRVQTLLGTWNCIQASRECYKNFKLSSPLVSEVVEHYLSDYSVIKLRYKISDKIQLHKIAGLMAASILRYRPAIPTLDVYTVKEEVFANEYLAIIHGIAICAEHTAEGDQLALMAEPWFPGWLENFLFLVHCRHYTAEGLIFVFETLSCLKFPHNISKVDS